MGTTQAQAQRGRAASQVGFQVKEAVPCRRPGAECHRGSTRFLAFEVSEDGARIHTQVARGAGAIAAVEAEHLVDVLPLPALARIGQGQDGG